MRRCFQCGVNTPPEKLTRVGDGEFCENCFQALLKQGPAAGDAVEPAQGVVDTPLDRAPDRGSVRRPSGSDSTATSGGSRCLICEERIFGEVGTTFLGGDICPRCTAELNAELAEQSEPEAKAASEEAPGNTELAQSSSDSTATLAQPGDNVHGEFDAEPSEAGASLFTPGAGTTVCAGCERPMPGPGSYRVIDGKPYCAACVPFYSRFRAQDAPAPSRTPMTHVELPDSGRCDCCGRTLEGTPVTHQGFRLCSACQSSDLELAVSVAKARHRRRLEALKGSLEADKS